MLDKPKDHAGHDTGSVRRLADWVNEFAAAPIPPATLECTRAILLDSLACALYAVGDEKAQGPLRAVEKLGGNGDCTVIGTRLRSGLPLATFANSVLIRTLDLNDTYTGPRGIGHPSDNIGAALAAAEMAKCSGEDLVRAIRMGYEIYGRILDIGDPDSPWDHVTVSGIVVAAMAGWLLRLPAERLAHAMALAVSHCATLGEVRVGHISGAKSIANAVVAQTACLQTLLAAEGTTGPAQALEGARGYAKLLLNGVDFSAFFREGAPDRLMSVGLKQYPCFALGQGPISAAIELRARLPQPIALEKLTVSVADTGPARLRLRDDLGRVPSSREAADHSLYFLVAVALLDGRFGLDQLGSGRWQDPATRAAVSAYELRIMRAFGIADQGRPGDKWLAEAVRWAWRTKILVTLSIDLRLRLWTAAEEEAVRIFASNLRDLLLAAPAGARPTLGLDPGYRTGVKVAVVDATGKVAATNTIYPHEPQRRWDEALAILAKLVREHKVELIAIGNGTASRETDKLATELLKGLADLGLHKVVVSEAGASVYSASAYASEELPDLDVTLRGAVSIARRLQDPLAELVKIDPKSIGVGQYQHDLSEFKLSRSLDAVVEDCVNGVGVDLNTASAPLLARVSGIGSALAQNIVSHRDTHGPFRSRKALKDVPRLGPKAFEQCAGFLRISAGDDPLDASAVHPESYPVVRRIIEATKSDIKVLIGNAPVLRALSPKSFVDDRFGLPTVTDILRELEKPGRDPRPAFKTAEFKAGVETLNDLTPGMVLEGVVTNVAAFGAFVDIGVHQDGLVHVSAMSKNFVKDPRNVVKPGDIVRVKVLEVDKPRKRISLSLRLDDQAGTQPARSAGVERSTTKRGQASGQAGNVSSSGGALADALRRAGFGGRNERR